MLIASMKLSRYLLQRHAGSAVDALLEVFREGVARRHGCHPVAWLLGYQELIVAASGLRPSPTQLTVERSPSVNYFF
jgi:hypothetical protein